MAPLTIILSGPLAKFLLLILGNFGSAGLEVFVPKREMLQPGDTTMIQLDWKVRLLLSYFGPLMPPNKQMKM